MSLILAIGFYLAHTPATRPHLELLRIGVLPDQEPQLLQQRLQPLLGYLTEKTGLPTVLVMPASYEELLKLFAQNKVDLVYFGGLTFVKAQTYHNAKPLVMREIDSRFVSYFISQGQQPKSELLEFKGASLRFGSLLSTSGHLMPRHFLKQELAIEADRYFADVSHSATHDETILAVRDGLVDVGASNANILKSMIRDGRLKKGDVKVIWQTPPYSDYVWAIQPHIPLKLERTLRNSFLSLSEANLKESQILASMGAKRFLPAGNHNFETLKNVAKNLNMLVQ